MATAKKSKGAKQAKQAKARAKRLQVTIRPRATMTAAEDRQLRAEVSDILNKAFADTVRAVRADASAKVDDGRLYSAAESPAADNRCERPETKSPVALGLIVDVTDNVGFLIGDLRELCSRLERLGDRLWGAQPTAGAEATSANESPNGQLAMLAAAVNHSRSTTIRAHMLLDRIEKEL